MMFPVKIGAKLFAAFLLPTLCFTVGIATAKSGSPSPVQHPPLKRQQYLYVCNRSKGQDYEKSNFISQYRIEQNGTLAPLIPAEVQTGKGLQNITAYASHPFVYAVNTGDNTISQYRVTHKGTLTPLAPPTVKTGQGLSRLVISPTGRFAYALEDQGLRQYEINSNGTLSSLTPAVIAERGGVLDIVFSKTGWFAYGVGASGLVYQWQIGRHGTMTPLGPPLHNKNENLQTLSLCPSGHFLYDLFWSSPCGVTGFRVNKNGRLSALPGPVLPLPENSTGVYFQPGGKFCDVPSYYTDRISRFEIGKNGDLKPLPVLKVPQGTQPNRFVFGPSGHTAYALSVSGAVRQYKIGNDSQLIALTPAEVANEPGFASLVFTPDCSFAYISREGANVSQYKVNANGTLSLLSPPSVSAGTNPFTMLILPAP